MHPVAAQSLLAKRRDNLGPYLLGSVLGHAALIALALIASSLWGNKMIDLDQKPITASLVRKGKPRDEKLLPRKEELPPPPQEVKGAEAPPTPEPVAPKPAAIPIPDPTAAPAKPSAPKQAGEKDGQDRRKQLFGAFSKTGKKAEELEGREDGDELGDSATGEGERYFGLIRAQARRHYDVSNTLSEQERLRLRANVALTVGRNGEVLEVKLAKGSGNELFDNAVVAAVKRASPFSPPPEHLRDKMQRQGIILSFTP